MIPNAPIGHPNMRVTKVITFDEVDFPSHPDANADIVAAVQESANVVFLKELAKYCCDKDENLNVICESFQISPEEIVGISNDPSVIIEQADTSRLRIPLRGEIRREALAILSNRGL